jgi:transcriptional regulator with XRE-family HTH domain
MEPQNPPGGADVAFGRRLRYLREQAGLTQQQLADVMREAGANRASEYTRQRDEAQILLDDTLAKLEDARARLKELEAEQ